MAVGGLLERRSLARYADLAFFDPATTARLGIVVLFCRAYAGIEERQGCITYDGNEPSTACQRLSRMPRQYGAGQPVSAPVAETATVRCWAARDGTVLGNATTRGRVEYG